MGHVFARHQFHGRQASPELADLLGRQHPLARPALPGLRQPRGRVEINEALVQGPVEHPVDENEDVVRARRPRRLGDLVAQAADLDPLDLGHDLAREIVFQVMLVDRQVQLGSRQLRFCVPFVPVLEEVREGQGLSPALLALGVRIAVLDLHLGQRRLRDFGGLGQAHRAGIAHPEPPPRALAARAALIPHVPGLGARRADVEPKPRNAFYPVTGLLPADHLGGLDLPMIAFQGGHFQRARRRSRSHTIHTPIRPLKVVRVVSGCKNGGNF